VDETEDSFVKQATQERNTSTERKERNLDVTNSVETTIQRYYTILERTNSEHILELRDIEKLLADQRLVLAQLIKPPKNAFA
jgi:hypothetical protein